jgi:phosphoribosylformylglycinamidine synthase
MLDHTTMATIRFKAAGQAIWLIGGPEHGGHLGQSLYLREILGREAGEPPVVDLAVERRNGEFVRELIADGRVSAVHDVADGGVLVALAEMALASGIGCTVEGLHDAASAFGEDQSRYLVTTPADILLSAPGVAVRRIGTTGGSAVTGDGFRVDVAALRARNEAFFRDWMEA